MQQSVPLSLEELDRRLKLIEEQRPATAPGPSNAQKTKGRLPFDLGALKTRCLNVCGKWRQSRTPVVRVKAQPADSWICQHCNQPNLAPVHRRHSASGLVAALGGVGAVGLAAAALGVSNQALHQQRIASLAAMMSARADVAQAVHANALDEYGASALDDKGAAKTLALSKATAVTNGFIGQFISDEKATQQCMLPQSAWRYRHRKCDEHLRAFFQKEDASLTWPLPPGNGRMMGVPTPSPPKAPPPPPVMTSAPMQPQSAPASEGAGSMPPGRSPITVFSPPPPPF